MTNEQKEICERDGFDCTDTKRRPPEMWDIIIDEEQERKERRKCKHQSKNQRN